MKLVSEEMQVFKLVGLHSLEITASLGVEYLGVRKCGEGVGKCTTVRLCSQYSRGESLAAGEGPEAGGRVPGRGAPAAVKGGCTCWETGLDSAHQGDEISPYPALKPHEAKGVGARAPKAHTEKLPLRNIHSRLRVATRPRKPAEFTQIIQAPSDPLVTILETQAI